MKNTILIIVDGMRKDRMGCYGYSKNTTPNIDKFSEKACIFNKCYAPHNNTLSGFATILTGLNPFFHGLMSHDDDKFEVKDKTIFETMHEKGYQNIFISPLTKKCKWMNRKVDKALSPRSPNNLVYSDNIIKKFEKIKKKKPFFAILHFYNCRHPFFHSKVKKFFNKDYDTGVAKQNQEYDNGIRQFDKDIKPLLDKYKDDNIIIMSDHGVHLGERGTVDQHFALDKHIINVPFITNSLRFGFIDKMFSQEDIKHLIVDNKVLFRKYILASEKTKRETVAIITENEIKKFEKVI